MIRVPRQMQHGAQPVMPWSSIDLAATFVEAAGGEVPDHIIEGRSLLPWLRGETPEWRDFVISEFDYSPTPQAVQLDVEPRDARLYMIFDGRWKMMHAEVGSAPCCLIWKMIPRNSMIWPKRARIRIRLIAFTRCWPSGDAGPHNALQNQNKTSKTCAANPCEGHFAIHV